MPSHIFTQLGMWQESIQSNIASGAMTKEVGNDPSHGMHFLIYAYLQGTQDVKAKQVLDELNAIQKGGGIGRQTGFAAMPARYVLESRAWSEAASLEPPPGLQPAAEAITYFARALGSARTGNVVNAQKAIEKIQSLREALLNTPAPFVFARESLGEMLIESNHAREALKEFEASLDRHPNRFHGLYGAARAAELSGNRGKAKTYYAKLVEICEKADTERAELKQVKAFLAKK